MSEARVDVLVVGGGPAGAVAALRLCQLGHGVVLVERSTFQRPRVGESLTHGIWPVLDVLGLRKAVEDEGFIQARESWVRWAESVPRRIGADQRGMGLLVDRGRFDSLLLEAAASAGVRVFQPGRVRRAIQDDRGWTLEVACGLEETSIRSAFLVDAAGRTGFIPGERIRVSPDTVAICGYLTGRGRPQATRVEAISEGWCWGAPVPGDMFSTMLFVDRAALGSVRSGTLETFWRSRLAGAQLFADLFGATSLGSVFARDATASYAHEPISRGIVRVGEANFSLDPLSSTGVEKALQTGLIAAVAIHSMILRPDDVDLCQRFYRERTAEVVSEHAAMSSTFYQNANHFPDSPFWATRSGASQNRASATPVPGRPTEGALVIPGKVRLSERACLVAEPCIVGNQIEAREALRHPSLDRPVAFIEGVEVAHLLDMIPPRLDLQLLVRLWSDRISPEKATRVAAWMIEHQILEAVS